MSTMMSCPRHYTLRTLNGHVIKFEPNTPKEVPDDCVEAAMAVNILPLEHNDLFSADTSGKLLGKVQLPGTLKDALAYYVIDLLRLENNTADFDGGGRPKAASINARSGLTISQKDVAEYWTKYRTMQSAGEDLPSHHALSHILEIQSLRTPKDFKDYAVALDVDKKHLEGRPISEQRNVLLAAALKV